MGRVGSSFGRGSDGAGDSQVAEFGMVSSTTEGGVWSCLSCGDEDEDLEDLERRSRQRLRMIGVWMEAFSIGLVVEKPY